MRVLKNARLVRDRREGTRRIYDLDPQGIAELRDHFSELWDKALSAFKRVAEEEYKKEKEHGGRNGAKYHGKKDPPRDSSR